MSTRPWYRVDADQVRRDWLDPTMTLRDMGDRQGVSGESIRQAAKKLGLPDRRRHLRSLTRMELVEAELDAALAASVEHDEDEDTPLEDGCWVLAGDRVLRWLSAPRMTEPETKPVAEPATEPDRRAS